MDTPSSNRIDPAGEAVKSIGKTMLLSICSQSPFAIP